MDGPPASSRIGEQTTGAGYEMEDARLVIETVVITCIYVVSIAVTVLWFFMDQD